ncbi:MAG: hypothetical protein ACRD63_17715 [Pyrinomonadaceae bacterium]
MFKKYFIYTMSLAFMIALIAPETNAQFRRRSDHKTRNTVIATGVGSGVGAIIGGLAGGGKGAGIGALVGGGAGAGGYLLKRHLDDNRYRGYYDNRNRRFNNNRFFNNNSYSRGNGSRRYYQPPYNDRYGRYHGGYYFNR